MYNRCIYQGRFVDDPRVIGSGSKITTYFSLAIQRNYKTKGEIKTDFIKCESYGKTAKVIQNYFKKGDMIFVEGQTIGKYDTKSGAYLNVAQINSVYFINNQDSTVSYEPKANDRE